MTDLHGLAGQIRRNCDISDARYAGVFSVCGLALRLRDLYKWEAGLPPWEERDTADILDWIGEREDRWVELANRELVPLSYNGSTCDPFDTETMNGWLEPLGYYYGAGFAHGLKPTFFLAPIVATDSVEALPVVIVGKELARDLLTLPALIQDNRILLRCDSAMFFFWDQMSYIRNSGRPFLKRALESMGDTDTSKSALRKHADKLFAIQREIYIRHEIGELVDETFDPDIWRELISDHPHSPVELLARAVKDLLADTNARGTLPHFSRNRNAAATALYAAFMDGLMGRLFSGFRPACEKSFQSGTWSEIDRVVAEGRAKAVTLAGNLMHLHQEGRRRGDSVWTRERIQEDILAPLLGRSGNK